MTRKNTIWLYVALTVLGVAAGWLWWNQFGCTRGCKLDASPWWNLFRGGLLGLLLANLIQSLIPRRKVTGDTPSTPENS